RDVKSADGGIELHGGDFVGDHFDRAGRVFDCDHSVWWYGVLRTDDYRSAGRDRDGAAGLHTVVCVDHVHRDTEYGDAYRRDNGGGVCDSDFLPGDYDGDGICGAGARGARWGVWVVCGFCG